LAGTIVTPPRAFRQPSHRSYRVARRRAAAAGTATLSIEGGSLSDGPRADDEDVLSDILQFMENSAHS
jgi:hypothetical protein